MPNDPQVPPGPHPAHRQDHARPQHVPAHSDRAPQATACCGAACTTSGASLPAGGAPGGLLLRIPAMDCPTEEGQIRRALAGIPGVERLHFDLAARALTVEAPAAARDAVVAAIAAAGFTTETLSAPPLAEETATARRAELVRLAAALAMATGAELVHALAPHSLAWQAAGMAIAAVAIALSGLGVFRKGLSSLRRRQLGINALMSVAVAGAFVIGQWPEAAMVMALYSLAELIEARSVARARHAIAGLLALAPAQAEVRQADGTWASVAASTVPVGAVVRVRPGERFALDGSVTAGQGAVDQSPITGESIPVDKTVGDPVFAGTINQAGALEFSVTRPATDTVLAGIMHAVEVAQGQRAPAQRLVDRFAAVYTPAVFVLALAVALGTPLLLGWTWLGAVYKALVLLVIACPCALVISTPVTVVSGLAAAARRGILIKGGAFLEQARLLQVIALDKTGTLTEGRPRLVAREVLSRDLPEATVVRIAASLAARSDHPVSLAIATGLDGEPLVVEHFGAEPGFGVHGSVDGHDYALGNHRWIHDRGQCTDELEARLQAHEVQGRTVSVLASRDQVLALFAVADSPRRTSREAVAELRSLGVHPLMLTGDNPSTARFIAGQVGIEDLRADLLPQDKREIVSELGARHAVGMVGDGVNDSPSLAAAAIGFSMGGAGTDTAKEAADVLIMDDDLRKVPETLRLSRRTYRVIWQNVVVALGIKLVFFAWAVFGGATMWMAVFADMGASLLVVFNGLRLLKTAR